MDSDGVDAVGQKEEERGYCCCCWSRCGDGQPGLAGVYVKSCPAAGPVAHKTSPAGQTAVRHVVKGVTIRSLALTASRSSLSAPCVVCDDGMQ